MTETELLALALRCEQATGPDRELDADLACASPLCRADYVLSAKPSIKRPGMVTRYFDEGGHGTFIADRYSGSLDAAMQLVPKGWHVNQLRNDWRTRHWRCDLALLPTDDQIRAYDGGSTFCVQSERGECETAPLALCSAALKAIASIGGSRGEARG